MHSLRTLHRYCSYSISCPAHKLLLLGKCVPFLYVVTRESVNCSYSLNSTASEQVVWRARREKQKNKSKPSIVDEFSGVLNRTDTLTPLHSMNLKQCQGVKSFERSQEQGARKYSPIRTEPLLPPVLVEVQNQVHFSQYISWGTEMTHSSQANQVVSARGLE